MKKLEDQLKNEIHKVLVTLFDDVVIREDQIEIEKPNDPKYGDYSTNIAMRLAGLLRQAQYDKSTNPIEVAEKIKVEILNQVQDTGLVSEVNVAGPGFINFFVNKHHIKTEIKKILQEGNNYGKGEDKKGKTVLIEHSSPNPTKEYHLGHFKNTITGLPISYLYEWQGAKVFRDAIDNNRGISIARLMWGYLNFAKKDESLPTDLNYWFDHQDEWKTPEDENKSPGKFVDKLYTLASEEFKKSEVVENEVRQLVIDWEAEDPKNHALWALTQKWVWEGFEKVLKRIDGWKFDKIWHESDIYKKGKEHVERGVKEGIFKKLDDGAILTDFEEKFGITDTILIKRDGTSLYITQDLELTHLKRKTFDPDEMIWIIGPEQSLAMKQMFAACSQLGFGDYHDFHHIPYGFILIEDDDGSISKMSSRDGTQISVDDLIDKAKKEIRTYISSDLTEDEKEEMSEKVAIGAIKYSLLKVSRTQDVAFNFKKTISLEGNSGPYILYTYARAKSVLNSSEIKILGDFDELKLDEESEIKLVSKLTEFKSICSNALRDYAPHYIATYVYELAQLFNHYYNTVKINGDDEALTKARLALTAATAQVIKNGLNLLGIETVEKM